ncbi:hypothetical protein ACH47X_21275 [Promicromonospora kroppenstedtii]|uniref:Membrane protein DUF2339 n=1 Tax=Promicromonospora kroppenstedtii TaxID=440482 RepID=A0ABW7XPI8_9MICO
MTKTAPGRRAEARGRTRAASLAAVLLLALSGLAALPAGLFSPEYHSDSWAVAAAAGPASVLPTLVLVAASVTYGSTIFLLLTTALATLHLVALAVLASAAANGPQDPQVFLSGPVVLGLALVGVALAWWDGTRADRRPAIALLAVTLAPVLGLLVDARQAGDGPWQIIGIGILVLQQVPVILTVLAAGLVCLPGRGARLGGAALIALSGAGLLWADSILSPATPLSGLRLAAISAAVVCALVAAAQAPGPADHDELDETDIAPPAAPPVATPAPTPTTVLPVRRLSTVALAILVLAVAVQVPELFAQGPGIRPGLAGPGPLVGLLVDAALPAALTLTAGAVTLRTRGVLVVASACSAGLAVALAVSRMTTGGGLALHDLLPFVVLGLALALAWATVPGPGRSDRAALRWAAVALLGLTASPLALLVDPAVDLAYLSRYLLSYPLAGAGPVVAAALLGVPRRGTRVAAAVLLSVLALVGVGFLLDDASGLRLAAALDLVRICGYGLAAVLAAAAALPRRDETGQPVPVGG